MAEDTGYHVPRVVSPISATFVAALSPEMKGERNELAEAATMAFEAGASALVIPSGREWPNAAQIQRAVGPFARVYRDVRTSDELSAVRAAGYRAIRLAGAAAANPSILGLVREMEEVLVPVAHLATAEIVSLAAKHRRPGFVLLCDAPWRIERGLIPLAFFRWLQSLKCSVGFAVTDHPTDIVGAVAMMDAALIEVRVGANAMSALTLRRLISSVRHAEAVAQGLAEHRTPDDVDGLDDLRESLVAVRAIPQGTVILEEMIGLRPPFNGLGPDCISAVVGRQALYDIVEGDFITFGVISV